MENKKITIIDETLREGMQYRGIVFSKEQRLTILDFQEKLKTDICQAGYPPAHESEADAVKILFQHARKNGYLTRIAAMGRANIFDAEILLSTRVNDLHFHLHIKNDITQGKLDTILHNLSATIEFIKKQNSRAVLSIAMLDIGRSDADVLEHCVLFLDQLPIDMISLPDTSGIMAPNHVYETIDWISARLKNTRISIHCHNDMGMASANSVMGILAGGRVLEASALGIGERNGIADLYTTVKTLQDQGFDIKLNTSDKDTFKAYYEYVDSIVFKQCRHPLLTDNTPFFGSAVKTHVAGTHSRGDYGMAKEEKFLLNVLCGKNLVKKYLNTSHIPYPDDILDTLTLKIKAESARFNRCLTRSEIRDLVFSLQGK